MSVKNSSRASDLGALLTTGTTGFVTRKRSALGLFVHYFLLACMVVLGTSLLVYYESPVGCALAVAIGLVFGYISQNMEKLKKTNQALEFMNALFSSALGKGHQFACVVKTSGEVIFFNRPFQAVFPAFIAQNDRKLDALLNLYQVPQEHREKLSALMQANTEGMVTTVIREEAATAGLSLTLYLEPIERPTGFFLLRGK